MENIYLARHIQVGFYLYNVKLKFNQLVVFPRSYDISDELRGQSQPTFPKINDFKFYL